MNNIVDDVEDVDIEKEFMVFLSLATNNSVFKF